jgi:hypothetical protein
MLKTQNGNLIAACKAAAAWAGHGRGDMQARNGDCTSLTRSEAPDREGTLGLQQEMRPGQQPVGLRGRTHDDRKDRGM